MPRSKLPPLYRAFRSASSGLRRPWFWWHAVTEPGFRERAKNTHSYYSVAKNQNIPANRPGDYRSSCTRLTYSYGANRREVLVLVFDRTAVASIDDPVEYLLTWSRTGPRLDVRSIRGEHVWPAMTIPPADVPRLVTRMAQAAATEQPIMLVDFLEARVVEGWVQPPRALRHGGTVANIATMPTNPPSQRTTPADVQTAKAG